MLLSGDIMGKANEFIEEKLNLVSLFVNGDAGDIDPANGACNSAPNFNGSNEMAQAVENLWSSIQPINQLSINVASATVSFGPTDLNATLGRFDNCTSGGPLDICSICEVLDCDLNAHLNEAWIENTPRFTGVLLQQNSETTLIVTLPGEGLVELGWQIRNDTLKMGFPRTFLYGYSNDHMGYFATPNEYDIGGYESQLTLWGIYTAEMVRNGTDLVGSPACFSA